jgi:DNA-directed RNA polymerase specialized sigma subunit
MVGWIQMMFGIQRYNEEMQVKFEYRCGPIIIGEVIALRHRKLLENDSVCSFCH